MTISKYTITHAFDKLTNALLNNDTKKTMYWLSEIMGSGNIEKLWYYVFDFYAMYIHIHYPNCIFYIYDKYKDYKVIKKNTRLIELRNSLKLREYFYRIFYIYSTVYKKFIIDVFAHQELFKSFREINQCHKQLIAGDVIMNDLSENDANEIIAFVNEQSKLPIDNALSQIKLSFKEFLHCYKDENDQTKFMIYHWLSYLLEKGSERFNLYKTDQYIHLQHAQNENKYSYFIWIIWNIVLEHSKKLSINPEIQILYRIYTNYEHHQSTNAYLIIITAYMLCLEKIKEKKIYIDDEKYLEYKYYFYQCFGFLEESLKKNEKRRDR